MYTVRADFPQDWPYANLYVIADEHEGDAFALHELTMEKVERVKKDPYGLCILNGDLANMALKNSVSDVYGESKKPMEQINAISDTYGPISGKIIGATMGNHEGRVYRNDGIDIMRLALRQMGIEDKYCPDGIFIFLRFGESKESNFHKGSKQWYTIYATHGSGGGRKEGSKAIRLADMAAIVDADIYIHSHTHMPMTMKNRYFRVSSANGTVAPVEKLFVNTGASVDYGGYGQAGEFKPSSLCTPSIHMEARTKNATAIL